MAHLRSFLSLGSFLDFFSFIGLMLADVCSWLCDVMGVGQPVRDVSRKKTTGKNGKNAFFFRFFSEGVGKKREKRKKIIGQNQ